MSKRHVVTVLWFLMGWTMGSFVAFLVGLPINVGLLVGIPFAAFVWRDPAGVLWTRTTTRPDDRRRVPMEEFARGLDADAKPAGDSERIPV